MVRKHLEILLRQRLSGSREPLPPTGISVTAREERSQNANRKLALARLADLFRRREEESARQAGNERWSQHHNLECGNAVRTHNTAGYSAYSSEANATTSRR